MLFRSQVARDLGLGTVRLHGGVPSEKRGALMDRFREDPATRVFLSTDAGGTGLNLQSASALVNLDLPWNPAVLEQRIARVHRLGQSEPVQIVLLVAADSYEQRVAALISGKRALFQGVVDAEHGEDTVAAGGGVLRRIVKELLGEDVGEITPDPLPEGGGSRGSEAEGEVRPDEAASDSAPTEAALISAPVESAAALAIEPAPAPARAPVPPLAPAPVSAEAPPEDPAAPARDELRRRVGAAEHLVEGGFVAESVEMLASAMLRALALRLGRRPPSGDGAAVWIWGELLPQGLLGAEEAAGISRALALARAPQVPEELGRAVLADARRCLREVGA